MHVGYLLLVHVSLNCNPASRLRDIITLACSRVRSGPPLATLVYLLFICHLVKHAIRDYSSDNGPVRRRELSRCKALLISDQILLMSHAIFYKCLTNIITILKLILHYIM